MKIVIKDIKVLKDVALVEYNNHFEISKEVKYVDSEILVEGVENVS